MTMIESELTDDERREIAERFRRLDRQARREMAARLRYVAEHGTPDWGGTAHCIAECVGKDDYPLWDSSSPLLAYLADLIEPKPERTCRNVDRSGGFACSECGVRAHVLVIDEDMCDWTKPPHPDYCPGCGAKVVNDDHR